MNLWQIDETKWDEASDLFRDFMRHQIKHGVLVPVKLDYEMLMTAAYALVDDVDGLAKYKAFVNKSLGIGDTE